MNILMAEDCPITRALNYDLMDTWGFHVDMAENGIQAVDLAFQNSGKYDLCVMDIEMPDMDGIEATRKMRQSLPYFPIMALTSNPDIRQTCLNEGFDEFMQKPCFPEQLFGIINALTTKFDQIDLRGEDVSVKKVMPMDSDELKELRALKQKGLTKLKLLGLGHSFVVHKNIQNKISHELIEEGRELSQFIDRDPSEPGLCHLFKTNLHITKDLFLPEELEEAIRKEDEVAMRFNESNVKKESD